MNYFTRHPHLNNMTYVSHMMFSFKISLYFLLRSVQASVHAINPNWFETTSSDTIGELKSYLKHN